MKRYYLIFTVFIFNFCFSQNTIIEYAYSIFQLERREYLIYNSSEAYYFDYVENDQKALDDIIVSYNIERGGEKYFRRLDNPNRLFYIKALPSTRKQLLWEDNKPAIDWKIDSQKKKILGYYCQHAKGKFRGREFSVWFTSEIPVALGPWKLDGLPGMILMAEEKDGIHRFEAIKIVKNSSLEIPKSVYNFLDNNELRIRPYKDLIIQSNFLLKEIQQKDLANSPKNSNSFSLPYFRESMREVYFEWEDTSKTIKPW